MFLQRFREQYPEAPDSPELSPAAPLWQHVPTRDSDGTRLSDFMMLIPKLKNEPQQVIQAVLAELEAALLQYQQYVVFADINLKLNVLWVSVRPVPGICLEIATAIHHRVPQAKLVSQRI